jgi:hypothetical protein
MPRVRVTRKFVAFIAGVDLRHAKAGDALDVTPEQARVLIADGWAEADDFEQQSSPTKAKPTRRTRGTGKRL